MKLIYKSYLLFCFLLLLGIEANAQQEQHFSQFTNNKLAYNIGYAGTDTKGKLRISHRSQWMGIEGAPKAQNISYNQSFMNKKVGAGLHLNRQTLGISTQWTLDLAYAYRIKIKKSTLGMGLGFSMRYFGKNFGDKRLVATESRFFDNTIPDGYKDRTVGNINLGVLFQSDAFYFGVSIPRLLDKNISLTNDQNEEAQEVKHYYFIAGGKYKIVENLAIEPNLLVKYVAGLPLGLYFNTNLRIQDQFSIGMTYHSGWKVGTINGNAIGLLVDVDLNKNWQLGLSYDYELSKIRSNTMGSFEIGLGYKIDTRNDSDIIKLDLN